MGNHGQHKNGHPEKKMQTVSPGRTSIGRGIFRIPRGRGGLILLVVVIVASYYQHPISAFFTGGSVPVKVAEAPVVPLERRGAVGNDATEFNASIVTTLEDTWQTLFHTQGLRYHPPHIVMYRKPVDSLCHHGHLAIGTFYCPQDDSVYISLTQYDAMRKQLGAGGDFTQGYMIAHAFGHHVQRLLKLESPGRVSSEHEFQADCLAGLWGHRMAEQQILSAGDLQQALNVAQVIDEEQSQLHQGMVLPENFLYGDLEQRHQWFNHGFVSGELEQCLHSDVVAIGS